MKLKDICSFQSGGTPCRTNSDFFSGRIPWITTVALNGQTIGSDSAVDWITEKAILESAAKLVPAGSIMVGTRVGVGKVAINTVPMSTSQDIISLIGVDESVWNKEFLCKFIQSKALYLKSQARGATIQGIKIDVLASLDLPTVSVGEQEKIVEKLNRISSIVAARKAQLVVIDKLIKARFVEMFGDEKSMIQMSELCTIITDGTHQPPKFVDRGIPFIFVSNLINNMVTYDSEKFIEQSTYDELLKRTPIEIGDILLTTVGSYGHPAVVKTERPFLFQRHIAYLKPKKELIDSDYLHGAILSSGTQRQIENSVKGIAQKTLNLSEIKKITIPVPPIELQRRFAAYVAQVDKSKAVVQKALDKAQLLFDSLMQKYFG